MQAAVERVIRSFRHKQPMQEAGTSAMHDDRQDQATHLATQLLERYRDQIGERSRKAEGAQQG